MRALAVTVVLLSTFAAQAMNQLACQDRCQKMVGVCQDQCVQRFPKGKQDACKHACKGAAPKCEERCKGGKQQ